MAHRHLVVNSGVGGDTATYPFGRIHRIGYPTGQVFRDPRINGRRLPVARGVGETLALLSPHAEHARRVIWCSQVRHG